MNLVFVDLVRSIKNAVALYNKIYKKDNRDKKAANKNIFLLLLIKN